jgi:FkbM family methyltransferase
MSIAERGPVMKVRRLVNRAGFDITREPYAYRFVRVLRSRGIDAVLDVGANTGQYARQLRDARFTGRLVSVEPLSSAYAQLERVAAADPSWAVQRVAVADAPGTLTIHVAGNSVSSSALPMLPAHSDPVPDSAYVGDEQVPATTVDALFRAYGLEPRTSLLKIDVQGFEASVLDGAATTLASVEAVQLELSLVPLYEGQALMPETVSRMAALGLDLWLTEPAFLDPRTGRMLQCDGLFVRR